MKYAIPKESNLTVTYNDNSYSKKYYRSPTLLTGVVDENHPNWDGSVTDEGSFRIVPELNRIYRCASNGATSFPLEKLNVEWVDYGTTNSYNMFSMDEHIGSRTVGENVVMEFDFSRLDTFALIDTKFISMRVEIINNDTSSTVYDETIKGSDIGCSSYAEYCYTDKKEKSRIIQSELIWLPNSTLRLSFTGNVEIGTCVIGNVKDLGLTLLGTTMSHESRSKINTNEITGYREVVRYGRVRVLDVELIFDRGEWNGVSASIEDILDKTVLWIPTEADNFSEAITLGWMEGTVLPMENSLKFKTTGSIVGVQR